MPYSSNTLGKINEIWGHFKCSTKTNQAKAAQAMGMNQSAFSQYLRGEIPLNTDFISKFSTLTNADVTEFIPNMAQGQVSLLPIRVDYTLSGRKLVDSYVLIPSPVSLDHAYAITVDYSDFIFERGTLLLVDTNAEIREHDAVMLHIADHRPIYGVISYRDNEWEVLEPHYFGGKRFTVTADAKIHRVAGTYNPQNQGRVFKEGQ